MKDIKLCYKLLRDNKDAIEQMTSELLEIEVITGEKS